MQMFSMRLSSDSPHAEGRYRGIYYRFDRIDSTGFDLDGRYYPPGSWLVKRDDWVHASAITAKRFAAAKRLAEWRKAPLKMSA